MAFLSGNSDNAVTRLILEGVEAYKSGWNQAAGAIDNAEKAAERYRNRLNMLANASLAVGTGIGAILAGGIRGQSQMEQQLVTLTTLFGDATKARQELDWAIKFAAKTPFTQPEVVDQLVTLTAAAQRARIPLHDLIRAAGDTASALGLSGDRARGFYLALSKGLGGTGGDELREWTKGALTLNQADFAAGGRYAGKSYGEALMEQMRPFSGQMDAMSKTMVGSISNLSDAWLELQRNVAAPIFEPLRGMIKWMADTVTNMSPAVKKLVAYLTLGVGAAAAIGGTYLKGKLLLEGLRASSAVQKIASGKAGGLLGAAGAMAIRANIVYVNGPLSGSAGGILSDLAGLSGRGAVAEAGTVVSRIGLLARVRAAAGSGWGKATALPYIGSTLEWGGGIVTRFLAPFGSVLGRAGGIVGKILPFFARMAPILAKIVPWLAQIGSKLIPIVGWVALGLQVLAAASPKLASSLGRLWEAIKSFGAGILPKIFTLAGKSWNLLQPAIRPVLWALDKLGTAVSYVVDGLSMMVEWINRATGAAQASQGAAPAGTAIWHAFLPALAANMIKMRSGADVDQLRSARYDALRDYYQLRTDEGDRSAKNSLAMLMRERYEQLMGDYRDSSKEIASYMASMIPNVIKASLAPGATPENTLRMMEEVNRTISEKQIAALEKYRQALGIRRELTDLQKGKGEDRQSWLTDMIIGGGERARRALSAWRIGPGTLNQARPMVKVDLNLSGISSLDEAFKRVAEATAQRTYELNERKLALQWGSVG